jgi:hypothetical protein
VARQSKPLGRKTGSRRPNRRFLIYCEGRITERIYIDGVKQELRNAGVQVEVGPKHGEPVGLVRAAAKHARRFTTSDPEHFDEVWCVFDVEAPRAHCGLDEATALAEQHSILCAITNPCFELFLLLHFGAQNGHLTTDAACELLERKKCCGYTTAGKRFDFAAVRPGRHAAEARARALDARHADSPLRERNPWTGFHVLLESLQSGTTT